MTVGEMIRVARHRVGYTQKELAEKSNVATVTIQQYERGVRQPRLEQLRLIAKALDVDWTDLVPEEDQGQTVIEHIREKLKGTPSERINAALDHLNDAGQQKAVERVEELTEIPKYQRQGAPQSASSSPTDENQSPQDPPEG